jgi:tetratricopeptide (TPR) repeat protein
LSDKYDAALDNYAEMEALADELGDPPLRLAALIGCAGVRSTFNALHDAVAARALLDRALALARELGDRQAEAKLLWNLMMLGYMVREDDERAVRYGEQSLALARELGLREMQAFVLNDVQWAYLALGRLDQARAALRAAGELWRELENLPMLSDCQAGASFLCFLGGDLDAALAIADDALRISGSIGSHSGPARTLRTVGLVWFERGEVDRAIAAMAESIRLGEEAGVLPALIVTRSELAWLYGTHGDVERGLELCTVARQVAEARLPPFRPWPLAIAARLHALGGDPGAAEIALAESRVGLEVEPSRLASFQVTLAEGELALATAEHARALAIADGLIARLHRSAIVAYVGDVLALRAAALRAQARLPEAEATLREARSVAERLEGRRTLWPVLAALSEIALARGDADASARLLAEARTIARAIADHIGRPELRAAFLSLPLVSALLASDPRVASNEAVTVGGTNTSFISPGSHQSMATTTQPVW